MNPSLLLIPDRYKASKLYSQIPDSGAGDLAFTRANDTATRVNSQGLIEKVRTNLVTYSNTFSDASWTKVASSVTQGATDPFGGSTAWTFESTASSGQAQIAKAITGTNTLSIYAKAGNTNILNFWIGSAVTFNLSTGLVTAGTGSMENVGNGWYRCIVPFTSHATINPYFDSTAIGQNILIAFAQQETGDIATDYIPTTTAAVSVGPVANIPRIDYTGGGCGKLLLEPQRTNLQLNSEDFSQANWSKTNTTIVVNQLASPDSYVNADKLNETAVNNIHQLESTRTVVAATQYTMSVFAKKAERSIVRVYEDTTNNGSYFDLNNGTLLTLTGPTASAKIENYGNGWYRCSVTYTETNTSGRYRILVTNADNVTSYLGVAGNGIYIYGAQYEAGAYPTSYIPTLGASVTRSADSASKTGISSLIGQSEGSIYWEGSINTLGAAAQLCDLNADGNKFIQIYNSLSGSTPTIGLYIQNVSVLLNIGNIATLTYDTNFKFALGYKNNDYVAYLNGVQVYTNTTIGVPPTSNFGIARTGQTAEESGKKVNAVALYTTRLSNAELASLTTL